jgi:malate synthase
VAHPGLVPIAKEIFDEYMKTPNQIDRKRDDVHVTPQDLLTVPQGDITEDGLRLNVDVGIQYLEAWLGGNGCVPIYNLMEDAATAEISRSQVWQWIRSPKGVLDDGRKVTAEMVRAMIPEELAKVKQVAPNGDNPSYARAAEIFEQMSTSQDFAEFLTLPLYEEI